VQGEREQIRGHLLFDEASGSIRDRLLAFGRAMVAFLSRPEMVRLEERIAAGGRTGAGATPMLPRFGSAADASTRWLACWSVSTRAETSNSTMPCRPPSTLQPCSSSLADMERRFTGHSDPAAAERRVQSAVTLFPRE
jgi:TetR/AcrR family transcriptional repressor of mexJK operon